MGVYIKGMKKPNNCYVCPLHYGHGDCSYAEVREHGSALEMICPMGELPDHGDLIDRDKLILALEMQDYSCAPDTLAEWTPMDMTKAEIADLKHAPVVISAERSKE